MLMLFPWPAPKSSTARMPSAVPSPSSGRRASPALPPVISSAPWASAGRASTTRSATSDASSSPRCAPTTPTASPPSRGSCAQAPRRWQPSSASSSTSPRCARRRALHADSADAAALERAIDEGAQTLGGLDVLVNNAGILIFGPVDTFSLEDFDKMLAINVRGVFVAAKAAARHLPQGGKILVVGSNTAERAMLAGAG